MDWLTVLLLLTALFSVPGSGTPVSLSRDLVAPVDPVANKAAKPCPDGKLIFGWGNSTSKKTYVYYYGCLDPSVCYDVRKESNDDIRTAWPLYWDGECTVFEHVGCNGKAMSILHPDYDEIHETMMKNISSYRCKLIPGWKKPPGTCPNWPNPPDGNCPSSTLASEEYGVEGLEAYADIEWVEDVPAVHRAEGAEPLQSVAAVASDHAVRTVDASDENPNAEDGETHAVNSADVTHVNSLDPAYLQKRDDLPCSDESYWRYPSDLLYVRYGLVRPPPPRHAMALILAACRLNRGQCYNMQLEANDSVWSFLPVVESYCVVYQLRHCAGHNYAIPYPGIFSAFNPNLDIKSYICKKLNETAVTTTSTSEATLGDDAVTTLASNSFVYGGDANDNARKMARSLEARQIVCTWGRIPVRLCTDDSCGAHCVFPYECTVVANLGEAMTDKATSFLSDMAANCYAYENEKCEGSGRKIDQEGYVMLAAGGQPSSFRCSSIPSEDLTRWLDKRQISCGPPNVLVNICIDELSCEVYCVPPSQCINISKAINNPANRFAAYGEARYCLAFRDEDCRQGRGVRIDPGSGRLDTTKLGGDFYSFRCDAALPGEIMQARDVTHRLEEPSIYPTELRDITHLLEKHHKGSDTADSLEFDDNSSVPETVDVAPPLEPSNVVPFALPVNTDVVASAEQACKIDMSMCARSFCESFCIVDNVCYNIAPIHNDKPEYVWMRNSNYHCHLYE